MSAAFYVLDACGDKFLYTIAGADYEPAFRKHARWWIGYMRKTRKGFDGRTIHGPVRPCRIVIEDLA
jgi:hypothetical protein